jgi:hypothetical protein
VPNLVLKRPKNVVVDLGNNDVMIKGFSFDGFQKDQMVTKGIKNESA